MADSDPSTSNTPPSHGMVMGRALLSGGIFGSIGAWIGHMLGRPANAPTHNVAQTIMKWAFGIILGFGAAYSSLRASEIEAKGEQRSADMPPEAMMTQAPQGQTMAAPRAQVGAVSIEQQGKLKEYAPEMSMRK